jgi:hypothetical protein
MSPELLVWHVAGAEGHHASWGRSAPVPRPDCATCGSPMGFDGSYPRGAREAGRLHRIFVRRARCGSLAPVKPSCLTSSCEAPWHYGLRRRRGPAPPRREGTAGRGGPLRRRAWAHRALLAPALRTARRRPRLTLRRAQRGVGWEHRARLPGAVRASCL